MIDFSKIIASDKAKAYGKVGLVLVNMIFIISMMTQFRSLKKEVIKSKDENRVVNLTQNQKISNTATANAYTIIIDRDILKNYTWELEEIRSGVEKHCPDGKLHLFSKNACFLRIKPSILDAYKTTTPLGFSFQVVGETVYVGYWKRNVTK